MIFDSVTAYFFIAFFVCLFTLIGGLFSFWITKKHAILDVFWGIGISMSIITVTRLNMSNFHILVYAMVLLWGIRLAVFILFTKVLSTHADARYSNMVKRSPTLLMIKQILIQAPLQALLVFTAYPLILDPVINPIWAIIGGGIFFVGFLGEIIADHQLYKHKQSSRNICNVGLWKYSRHPNYFFEWLIWMGISVTFIGQPLFGVSFIGPLSIFIIMYFITGPYTEKCSLKRRGKDYQTYQETTPYFFPGKRLLK